MSTFESVTLADIQSAETIGLPAGERGEAFQRIFTKVTGIEVPQPPPGKLWARAGGQDFVFLRNMDMPDRVQEGLIDVGVFGTDAEYENGDPAKLVIEELSDEELCRFSVLTSPDEVESFRRFMSVERRYAVPTTWLPTSLPRALERAARMYDYPFRACSLKIGGKVEAYARLMGAKALADRVQTLNSARQNGLDEAFKIFPVRVKVGKKVVQNCKEMTDIGESR